MGHATISPNMSVRQVAELIERYQSKDIEVYVRIESIRGKPVAYIVRDKRSHHVALTRKQAE